MKKSLKTLLATGLTGIALVTGGLVAATPAAAAGTPACDTGRYLGVDDYHRSFQPYSVGSRGWFKCKIKYGQDGVEVRALQVTLNRCYGKGLETDGVFGSGTRQALVSVQKKIGVSADGVYGPKTRAKMKWAQNSKSTNRFAYCATI